MNHETFNHAENNTNSDHDQSLEVGAKALSSINFESSQKQIVDSSFQKAREQGERLPGKNNERRNYSYLHRMEKLISRYGNEGEKRLWQQSANKLIINPEDIPESYWRSQEEILRDNGQIRELTETEKKEKTLTIIEHQRKSIESWTNYLGDEHSPYPLWFKIYAFNGASKMGVFDKDKQQFSKRDKHTIAPFPKINASVLAKTYDIVKSFYEGSNHNDSDSEELQDIVKSGSFNKIYSAILLREKPTPKTPERAEDVNGEWIEYTRGHEKELAEAAEGTPWCIADPSTGKNYLELGTYHFNLHSPNEEDKAKFLLFHLYDPETNLLSPNACASIRLDLDGNVAEISGLNDGQALEEAIVPTVEKKVKNLPGGERFLDAFADKKELIRLDHKRRNRDYDDPEQGFSEEEIDFIFELTRPITTLDTYNEVDDRIPILKSHIINFDFDTLISMTYPEDLLNIFENDMSSAQRSQYLQQILDNDNMTLNHYYYHSIEDKILSEPYYLTSDNIHSLLELGTEPEKILNSCLLKTTLPPSGLNVKYAKPSREAYDAILDSAEDLLNHGATLDLKEISHNAHGYIVWKHYDFLQEHGVSVDINSILPEIRDSEIKDNIESLLSRGANINTIVGTLYTKGSSLEKLLEQFSNFDGFDVNYYIDKIAFVDESDSRNSSFIEDEEKDIAALLKHGVDPHKILRKLPYSRLRSRNYQELLMQFGVEWSSIDEIEREKWREIDNKRRYVYDHRGRAAGYYNDGDDEYFMAYKSKN